MTICDINTCRKPLPKTGERYTGVFLDNKYVFCKQCYLCLVAFVKRRFSSDEASKTILDPSLAEQLLVGLPIVPEPYTITFPPVGTPSKTNAPAPYDNGFFIISASDTNIPIGYPK